MEISLQSLKISKTSILFSLNFYRIYSIFKMVSLTSIDDISKCRYRLFSTIFYSEHNVDQATKFGVNDWAVTPSFPYFLNKLNNPLLSYFQLRIFLLLFPRIFHYCSCSISVLVSLENYSNLFVI